MKIYYVLLAICLSAFACEKDKTEGVPASIEGSHIDIAEVKNYLPQAYFQSAKLIYKNAEGQEVRLNSIPTEGTSQRILDGFNYTSEGFDIQLYTDVGVEPVIKIVVAGGAAYLNDGRTISKTLDAILMPANTAGNTWAIVEFKDGKPAVTVFDDFREEVSLLDKSFKDVFMTRGMNGNVIIDAYSELDVNSEVGIVAFRDLANELWVFDRFED